jgi:hypothetical protein
MPQANAPLVTHTLTDDKNVLAAIGVIALRHGQPDNQLKMLIQDLSGVTRAEALGATARNGSRELRDRARRFARGRLGEGTALIKIQAFLTEAARLTARRNQPLHGIWDTELDTNILMIGDEGHVFENAPTAADLVELSDEITELVGQIVNARLKGFVCEALQSRGGK